MLFRSYIDPWNVADVNEVTSNPGHPHPYGGVNLSQQSVDFHKSLASLVKKWQAMDATFKVKDPAYLHIV